jgi:hypothetical protein
MFSVNKTCDAAVDRVDDLWHQLPGSRGNGQTGECPSTTQPTRPSPPSRAQGRYPRVQQPAVRPSHWNSHTTANSCYLNLVLQVFLAQIVKLLCDPQTNVACTCRYSSTLAGTQTTTETLDAVMPRGSTALKGTHALTDQFGFGALFPYQLLIIPPAGTSAQCVQ